MKNFVIGLIIGLMLGGGVTWAAATRVSLQNGAGAEIGTQTSPVYVKVI